jgi:hypothetical protein
MHVYTLACIYISFILNSGPRNALEFLSQLLENGDSECSEDILYGAAVDVVNELGGYVYFPTWYYLLRTTPDTKDSVLRNFCEKALILATLNNESFSYYDDELLSVIINIAKNAINGTNNITVKESAYNHVLYLLIKEYSAVPEKYSHKFLVIGTLSDLLKNRIGIKRPSYRKIWVDRRRSLNIQTDKKDIVAKGSYGKIYKVTTDFGSVAVKSQSWRVFPEAVNEIAAMRLIMYGNVQPIRDTYLSSTKILYSMPYCEYNLESMIYRTEDVTTRLKHRSRSYKDCLYISDIPPKVARKLMVDCLKGLTYIHQCGIIHCDIKPSNILISDASNNGDAKIADFGCCIPYSKGNKDFEVRLKLPCSIPYRSYAVTKQELLDIPIRHSSGIDVWAMAVVFMEIITGTIPFYSDKNCSGKKSLAKQLANMNRYIVEEKLAFISNPDMRSLLLEMFNYNEYQRITARRALEKLDSI